MAPTLTADPPPAALVPEVRRVPEPEQTLPPASASGHWLAYVFLWALAVGMVALWSANYYRTAVAADQLEAAYRAAPSNVAGRGLLSHEPSSQPPVQFDPDGFSWINLTQAQIADGAVRPHEEPWDNAPLGRERHWSGSLSGWLLLLGGASHLVTGAPLTEAMTQAAAWANPILFVLFLTALGLVLWRRIGAWPAGIFLVTLAALDGVEWDFSYGRPDHHGLHLMVFLGLVLGTLLAGLGWVAEGPAANGSESGSFVQPRTLRTARAWFTFSGVCGGLGLWIGAAQQCVCIAILGTGAVLGALLFARPALAAETSRFEPALWRHWARVGAATSFLFYLLEYFPSHLEMRLEVNHPLFALGWLGAGEWMYLILLARVDRATLRARPGAALLGGGFGLLALLALPLALVLGPASWFLPRDPILLRSTKIVSEGMAWLQTPGLSAALGQFWRYSGVLLLGMPLALLILGWRGRTLTPAQRSSLVVTLLAAAAFLGWTLLQHRWMGFLESSLAILALVAAPCIPMRSRRAGALPLALLALTVPGWAGYADLRIGGLQQDAADQARAVLGDLMAVKETAWNLRHDSEQAGLTRPARVMGPFAASPALHYYGGVDTVGSFYWENVAGMHAGLDFFMDPGDADARRIARERGLDFVLVQTMPNFVLQMQLLQLGRLDPGLARRTLAFRLANPNAARPPAWLEMVPLADAPLAQAEGFRIYRVVKEKL